MKCVSLYSYIPTVLVKVQCTRIFLLTYSYRARVISGFKQLNPLPIAILGKVWRCVICLLRNALNVIVVVVYVVVILLLFLLFPV